MNAKTLAGLGMWETWKNQVEKSLPNFAGEGFYATQWNYSEKRFCEVAEEVKKFGPIDLGGETRDAEFGARLVKTCLGPVTRMWLDGNVEIQFLKKHLCLEGTRALDIGAGYGRLAVMMAPITGAVYCVDAVPVSTKLCREYTGRFAPSVKVLDLEEFCDNPPTVDLAINIHSWNECNLEQVEAWIDAIVEMKIPYLFTVDHGNTESSYKAWNQFMPSFRPALEKHFDLVTEEILAIEENPHALWRLKNA